MFSRPVIKAVGTEVSLNLANRESIISELGDKYIKFGYHQLVLHNSAGNHNVQGLPLLPKGALQLDIACMGGYSYIICQYVQSGRRFYTQVNWNNEVLNLNWVEILTSGNGVMTSGNQNIGGKKTFGNVADFALGLRFSAANKEQWATLGVGASDVYLHNPISNKFLQMRDDGVLRYDNQKVMLLSDRSDAVNLNSSDKFATSKALKIVNDKADRATPPGTVAYFAGQNTPAGWLKANGAAVSRTTYAGLFAAIGTTYGAGDGRTTFNLPDLRGEFVRGWDDGRNVDKNRALGSKQDDAFQGHARNLKRSQSDARMHGFNYYQNVEINTNRHSPAPAALNTGDNWLTEDYLPHKNYGTPRVADETRPRNIALMACIKI